MTAIKQLAGQTLWYGLSNVGARLLNYALTPILTYLMHSKAEQVQYGNMSLIYAWIAFANIIFTYGFETAYFRFTNKVDTQNKVIFSTAFASLLLSTLFFSILLFVFRSSIGQFFDIGNHLNYISWIILLIGLDTISAIPFAKLRQDNKPRKYAFIKVMGIVVNLIAVIFLMVYFPNWVKAHPNNAIAQWFLKQDKLGIIIFSNLLQNIFVFAALYKEWGSFRFEFDKGIWKKMFAYSSPMIIVGLAGMVNEVMDRQMLEWRLPVNAAFSNAGDVKMMVGIYSANYKLAIFITLFIQAFKMAAEPFFFSQASDKNAPVLYARVMKWFVIVLGIAFLFTTLYIDVLKYFVGSSYRSGIGIVPILLMANVFLGIYYNLSIWYKLTDKMRIGMYITLMGATITIVGNYVFIPYFGMYAAAWSTFFCYGIMVVVTYRVGQKYFPVPYPVKKLIAYLSVAVILFAVQVLISSFTNNHSEKFQLIFHTISATLLLGLYLILVFKVEKNELEKMPLVGRLVRKIG